MYILKLLENWAILCIECCFECANRYIYQIIVQEEKHAKGLSIKRSDFSCN
jgi:hypothetical protein